MEQKDKENFIRQLLDAYFLMRRPLPEEGATRQNRTTQSIQEELEPMYRLDGETIIDYMLEHEYGTVTEPDGTVAWAVWRIFGES
jgi:hypothetical protein